MTEAPWVAMAWALLEEAARTGPLVDATAWEAGVAALGARYEALAVGAVPTLAERARNQLEALGTYAETITRAARGGNRVPYRVREADWSGRLTIEAPLWQSVTKDGDLVLRRAVVAPPGHLILCADWHASQLYLLAGLSGDTQLAADLASGDIYLTLGDSLAPGHPRARDLGKLLVLAITYRAGARTLTAKAREKGVDIGADQIVALLGRLRARYATLWAWGEAIQPVGYHLLWTPGGRRVQLRPDPERPPRAQGASAAPSLPTVLAGIAQAWEADALLASLAVLAPELGDLGLRLVLHLHDCIVWEVRADLVESAVRRVSEVMVSTHAGMQRWVPQAGSAPRESAAGMHHGAPVGLATGSSWGGATPYPTE